MWQEAAAAEGNAGILPTTGDVAGPAPAAPAGRRQMVQAEPLEPGCTSDGPDQEARGIVETGRQEIIAPPRPTPTRPIRNVVVFGAGGPVAAAAVQELVSAFKLRLTDVRPIAEIEAAGKPNYPGAPVPVAFGPPHECRVVDVRDSAAVSEACADMDAILDCTVVRDDPVAAFTVNTVGAYNIARAAVGHGIRRIVLTGPQLVILDEAVGYLSGYDVPSEAPPRPGSDLYGMSKYLGQEIFRVFADWYGLEVPVLLFCAFVADNKVDRAHPFSITWRDSARALRYALTTPGLPSPFEVFNILADLPHGRFTNRKAKSLLGWEPLDSLETAWTYRDV
jgi:nucleoside-diphosphate-sugar epimerase